MAIERPRPVGYTTPLAETIMGLDPFVLAIDPGPTRSGYVIYAPARKRRPVVNSGKVDTDEVLKLIGTLSAWTELVIEEFVSYGRSVGTADSLRTVLNVGRFIQCAHERQRGTTLVPRRNHARYVGNSHVAKDQDIAREIIRMFGGTRSIAVGLKGSPGPLYGVKADAWMALSVAIFYTEVVLGYPPRQGSSGVTPQVEADRGSSG